MLIIEGPDCVGKTTLARKLTSMLAEEGYVYAHFTRLPVGFDRYWGYVERMSQRVVQDRFHMSEILYQPARNDVSPLTPEGYRLIDAQLRLLGAFTVVLTADAELVRERYVIKDQMFSLDQTLMTAGLYQSLTDPDMRPAFDTYTMDIDSSFHCTKDMPYANDTFASEVVRVYRARQWTTQQIAKRRAPAL